MSIVYNPDTGQYEDDTLSTVPATGPSADGRGVGGILADRTAAIDPRSTRPPSPTWDPMDGLRQIRAAFEAAGHHPTGEDMLTWGPAPSKEEVSQALQFINVTYSGAPKNGATTNTNTNTGPADTNTNPNTSTATPFTGGMAEFVQMFGSPSTPAQLTALEQRLNAAGITIARNAAGVAGKIRLPNGQIIDVIQNADKGGTGFWWGEGGGNNANGAGGDFALNPDYLAPFTTPFEPGADTQLPTPPGGQPFAYPDFNVPDPSKIALDPSYQFRLNQGIDAIKSNKAAMGTLNTGGTIKDYLNYGQGAASQEYSNIFDRNFRTWGANRDNAFGSWAANTTQANTGFGQQKSLADDAYSRAWQKYRGLEDTFRANQNGPSQKLLALANIGSSAASV